MAVPSSPAVSPPAIPPALLRLLACPASGESLRQEGGQLVSGSGTHRYPVSPSGIPMFAVGALAGEVGIQRAHYDRVAEDYIVNLEYPHTREYLSYLDGALLDAARDADLGAVAELCCGRGEAFALLGERVGVGAGVDISPAMLEFARSAHPAERILFVQGDVTRLPLSAGHFGSVFMLGGIHHVNDRASLFAEVCRILRPGGRFYWREPVDDFFLWRWLRAVIYRVSDHLDHETEHPLRREATLAALEGAGLRPRVWETYGFVGFCLFMNSDVLVFNRLLRFLPGIRGITRFMARLDEGFRRIPFLRGAGLQVIGCAEKPAGGEESA